jgi:hypothetical protein
MSTKPSKTINCNYYYLDTEEADEAAIKMISKIHGFGGYSTRYLILRIVGHKKYTWFSNLQAGEKITIEHMLELLR